MPFKHSMTQFLVSAVFCPTLCFTCFPTYCTLIQSFVHLCVLTLLVGCIILQVSHSLSCFLFLFFFHVLLCTGSLSKDMFFLPSCIPYLSYYAMQSYRSINSKFEGIYSILCNPFSLHVICHSCMTQKPQMVYNYNADFLYHIW